MSAQTAEPVSLGNLSTDQLHALAADPRVSLCWSHGVVEPLTNGEPYIVCFECGHVYQTAADLVAAYEREAKRDAPPPHEIFFCQECIHDF